MTQECEAQECEARECEAGTAGSCPTCGTPLHGAPAVGIGERPLRATGTTGDRQGWTLEDYARWAKSAFLPPADPA